MSTHLYPSKKKKLEGGEVTGRVTNFLQVIGSTTEGVVNINANVEALSVAFCEIAHFLMNRKHKFLEK